MFIKTDKLSINITTQSKRLDIERLLFEEKSQICREIMEIQLVYDYTSVLKAQPRQHISNIYIYLYVSYQSVYTGSEHISRVVKIYIFFCLKIFFTFTNSVDPDEMQGNAAFHLGLHCLQKYLLWIS